MPVTNEKERIKLSSAQRVLPTYSGRTGREKLGENAASPTIPPRIATAFRPIWTTVKNMPGFSCIFRTRWAFYIAFISQQFKFDLREAASEIGHREERTYSDQTEYD